MALIKKTSESHRFTTLEISRYHFDRKGRGLYKKIVILLNSAIDLIEQLYNFAELREYLTYV